MLKPTYMGQPARLPSPARPRSCLQGGRSREHQNIIIRVDIAVICSTDCTLSPISATVDLSSAEITVERQDWTTERLAKIKEERYRIEPNTMIASPTRAFTLPEAFDVRFYFRHPQALAIDSASVRLTVADANGHRAEQMLRIPIR